MGDDLDVADEAEVGEVTAEADPPDDDALLDPVRSLDEGDAIAVADHLEDVEAIARGSQRAPREVLADGALAR